MKQDKYLVIVGGPTAVGKTNITIELAKKLKCDIISADSRQFYREMNIGTAKPTAEELSQAKHHFVDSLSIQEDYSVGKFEIDTLDLLDSLWQENKYCILTGGSGLYLNAIVNGLDKFPDIAPSFRQALNLEYEQNGLDKLIDELKQKDPTYAHKVDQANPQRIIRALEVVRATGQPFSSFLRQKPVERPFHILTFQLTMDRLKLYERINKRVDIMVEMGLEAEARGLLPYKALNALRTVGYSEWFDHFAGKTGRSEAIELIKRNTRRYAKRQITWFKNQGDYTSVPQNGKGLTTLLDIIEHKHRS